MHHTKQNPKLGNTYAYTRSVVFLGTPHRGSDKTGYAEVITRIASAALRQPNKRLVDILKQDSEVLEAQRSSFSAISKEMPVACICETKPVTGIGMVSANNTSRLCGLTNFVQIVCSTSATKTAY